MRLAVLPRTDERQRRPDRARLHLSRMPVLFITEGGESEVCTLAGTATYTKAGN